MVGLLWGMGSTGAVSSLDSLFSTLDLSLLDAFCLSSSLLDFSLSSESVSALEVVAGVVAEASFANFKENPMDGYSISGYINNDKKLSFTAGIRSVDDFQFDTDISYTDELGRKFNKNPKSVSEIKKEQNTSNK